jgi:hypothetical protein
LVRSSWRRGVKRDRSPIEMSASNALGSCDITSGGPSVRDWYVVTRDYALGSETGWHTNHEHLRNLSQSAMSATIFPNRITMCSSFYSSNHDSCLLPSFPFHPRASAFAATTAVHVHIKPHPHHATTATFDKAPSEPAANACRQRMPSPPDTTTHAAHTRHCISFHSAISLASPRHATPRTTWCHTTPCHAMPPRLAAIVPTLDFPSLICFLCSAVV